jgi:hypothetical protein
VINLPFKRGRSAIDLDELIDGASIAECVIFLGSGNRTVSVVTARICCPANSGAVSGDPAQALPILCPIFPIARALTNYVFGYVLVHRKSLTACVFHYNRTQLINEY